MLHLADKRSKCLCGQTRPRSSCVISSRRTWEQMIAGRLWLLWNHAQLRFGTDMVTSQLRLQCFDVDGIATASSFFVMCSCSCCKTPSPAPYRLILNPSVAIRSRLQLCQLSMISPGPSSALAALACPSLLCRWLGTCLKSDLNFSSLNRTLPCCASQPHRNPTHCLSMAHLTPPLALEPPHK